ncbi:MAG: hypothetical protein FWF08_09745 [Oscillospiraceae bacterium]|nr:hypothetical protein [Oscillospiraceae bacterium]
MTLSTNEEDILEKIVGFGGYATKEMLALYRHDITEDRCYRILKNLEKKKFIKTREYFTSQRQPDVYQVTKKACRFFGRAEAYMRKKHQPFAMRRYLIRSHFLFLLAGQGIKVSHFFSDSRADFLKAKGFSEYYLPKKNDKVQIDEYIIDDERYTRGKTITVFYADNPEDNPYRQISILLDKYSLILKSNSFFIDFLVVTEERVKADSYLKIYRSKFFQSVSMYDIKTKSIGRTYKVN